MNIKLNAESLQRLVEERARRMLTAGAIVIENATRQLISVPAPRKAVTSRAGIRYYRATVGATPGAPPRKLSGVLRRRLTHEVDVPNRIARIGVNTPYAARLESENHRYLTLALQRHGKEAYEAMVRAGQQGGP
jgi:hypothetical protein